MVADIQIQNFGSVVVIQPFTQEGIDWVEANLVSDETLRWGQHAVVAEPRYVQRIIDGAQDDGLAVAV
jgi:hypothetical protein